MDIAIMVEGQMGLTWERWMRMAHAVEDLGFAGLYRSDHYVNAKPPDQASLELWVSLTWLADNTERIEFGPLVSPVSFRHPTMTARMGAAVHDLSERRLHLGIGAGWQEREHNNYGWELLEISERFDRFKEGLEVVSLLLKSDQHVAYDGEYYHLEDAILLPRPAYDDGPPILVGGNGRNRTLRYAATYASLWNAVFVPPQQFAELNDVLDGYLSELGRDFRDVHRSVMTGLYFGTDEDAVKERLGDRDRSKLRERGVIVGTPDEVVEQLQGFADAGAQRVMLQWLDLDDMDGLQALADAVLDEFPSQHEATP